MKKLIVKNKQGNRFAPLPRKNALCTLQLNGHFAAKYLGQDKEGNRRFEIVEKLTEGVVS